MFVGLWLVDRGATILELPVFVVLKSSIAAAAVAAAALFWWVSERTWLALGFGAALILSAALAYLDVMMLPCLLVGFWFLERQRLAAAGFFLSAALLIKWQPLILLPFLLIHACALHRGGGTSWIDRGRRLSQLAAGTIPVVTLVLVLVPVYDVLAAFRRTAVLHGRSRPPS